MWEKYLKNLKSVKFSESYISMGLGLVVVLVIGVLLYNFFSGRTKPENSSLEAAKTEQQKEKAGFPKSYIVVSGDNLWIISEKNYNSGYKWVDLAKANNLTNPDYLLEGQVLTLPQLSNPSINGNGTTSESITGESYTVVEDDDLWDIAVRAYGDGYQWTKLASANQLVNPDLIHTGNILSIPR